MSLIVILAENPLQRETWEKFENYSNLGDFFLQEMAPRYGGHFPQSAKIYREKIDSDHDITPATPKDAEDLISVKGLIYVVIWPAAQAVAVQLAVQVGILLLSTGLKALIDKDEKVTSRKVPSGSPNNLPGQRKNTARLLQRIPDLYGRVKATPDLIQYPLISYEDNLQVETIAAVIGRGSYDIEEDEIFEGTTRVNQIPGSSLAIYAPTDIPVLDTPQLQIGPAIDDPLLTVIPVREVTGEQLLAPNNTYIFGEDDEWTDHWDSGEPRSHAALFSYPSAGVGKITFNWVNDKRAEQQQSNYFTQRLSVGDRFGLRWQGNATGLPSAMVARGAVSIHFADLIMGSGGDANIPDLELLPVTIDEDHYEVTAVAFPSTTLVEYTISVPVSKQAEWAKIALFNPDGAGLGIAAPGSMYNRMTMIYVLNFRLGPFFCNDPNMEEVHLNFIADKGLWIDDGKRQRAYGVADTSADPGATGGINITVEFTPADENGVATGPKETQTVTMFGSSSKRDFIGQTFKLTPTFSGPFLISVYRNTLQYWRTEPRAWRYVSVDHEELNWAETRGSIFGKLYVPHIYQYADDIKWTHCYSVSTPTFPVSKLGDVTIVHSRTAQVKYVAPREYEKNLNMIVTRSIPFWDGTTLAGSAPTTRGLDAAFNVMTSYYLGNVPQANIDFENIAAAFAEVDDTTGDQNMTNFSHTFDSVDASLEDMLSAIGESCFVTFYRQGNIIKAIADVSRENSSLIFNHRNMLVGPESLQVSFGPEEEYDGVEIEYSDNADNHLKTYTATLSLVPPRNPMKIRVAGVRAKEKAALHAWRTAHRLQYQNTTVEFDACEEAALSLVNDKVLIATGTRPNVQDGEIVRIDGLTVYTSKEIDVNPGSSYTLFIQDVDGSVQAIPVVTDSTTNGLVLDGAPSGTLVIDADAGIFPKYFLVRDQDTQPSAFHIKEAQYKNRGAYSVTATNYTEGYYFYDALRLWLPFYDYATFPPIGVFDDRSAYEHEVTEFGSPITVNDPDRGAVFDDNGGGYVFYEDFRYTTNTPYTIAAWIKIDSFGGVICQSDDGFEFTVQLNSGSSEVIVYHTGVEYASTLGVEVDEWYHVGVVYHSDTEILIIYINGEESSRALDVPTFNQFDGLRVFQFSGRGDDFRAYRRAKSAQFMRELYQKSLFPAF